MWWQERPLLVVSKRQDNQNHVALCHRTGTKLPQQKRSTPKFAGLHPICGGEGNTWIMRRPMTSWETMVCTDPPIIFTRGSLSRSDISATTCDCNIKSPHQSPDTSMASVSHVLLCCYLSASMISAPAKYKFCAGECDWRAMAWI